MKLIDIPKYYSKVEYDQSIQKVTLKLKENPAVKTVYQVGSVSTLGISDVDLCVIFQDGMEFTQNPLGDLSVTDRYFFCHGLFGLRESDFYESSKYGFFQDYKLLSGIELRDNAVESGCENLEDVTRQVALEYMIKAFIVLNTEREFRVIKVRNFLLHTKALLLDLEPLGFNQDQHGLLSLLNKILNVRNEWFSKSSDENLIEGLHENLYQSLKQCLKEYFETEKFWHVNTASVGISTNVKISHAPAFQAQFRGLKLPVFITGLNRRAFNLQRRFCWFEYRLPMTDSEPTGNLFERYYLIKKMIQYNEAKLTHFIPVPFGLPLFGTFTTAH